MSDRPTVLIRFSGEVSIKSRGTREQFCRKLGGNLRDALESAGVEHRVRRLWSRILLSAAESERAAEVAATVFGVQSASPVETLEWRDLDDLVGRAAPRAEPAVRGRRFAVRARRGVQLERIPFRSPDVERRLGSLLLDASAGVDLDEPEVTVGLEVHPERAFLFTRTVDGHGGLPVGVEGRALALLSGGFDSAVASWLMLKRGVALDYVFFNLGGREHEIGALTVARHLARAWSFGDRPRLTAIDFRPLVADLRQRVEPRLWQVVLKRAMLALAGRLAERRGHPMLVTGDAVGQVSSQTLSNLAAISVATPVPILRPLAGFNKDEIVARAREIGTYDLSAGLAEHCALLDRRPATAVDAADAAAAEEELGEAWRRVAWRTRRRLDLRRLSDADLDPGDVAVAEPPPGARLLDLRPRRAFRSDHLEGALDLPWEEAMLAYPSLDREATWVLVCEVGLKSAQLAEAMRREGFAAHSLEGGLKGYRKRRRVPARG